jgi:hypothetical protein
MTAHPQSGTSPGTIPGTKPGTDHTPGPRAAFSVGVVGIGIMGSAIAARLLGCGHAVAVFDLDAAKLAPLAAEGARAAGSAADAARGAHFVITSLNSAAIVHAAVFGAAGVAEALGAGALVIDMSSIDPPATHRKNRPSAATTSAACRGGRSTAGIWARIRSTHRSIGPSAGRDVASSAVGPVAASDARAPAPAGCAAALLAKFTASAQITARPPAPGRSCASLAPPRGVCSQRCGFRPRPRSRPPAAARRRAPRQMGAAQVQADGPTPAPCKGMVAGAAIAHAAAVSALVGGAPKS